MHMAVASSWAGRVLAWQTNHVPTIHVKLYVLELVSWAISDWLFWSSGQELKQTQHYTIIKFSLILMDLDNWHMYIPQQCFTKLNV